VTVGIWGSSADGPKWWK